MERLIKLIKGILSYIECNVPDGYVTKTKLLKYLYLIDIEHYKRSGNTYTDFNWIFYKYGPWTHEFETLFEEAVRLEEIAVNKGNRIDLDTTFIRYEGDEVELSGLFSNINEELVIRRILEQWADKPLADMLDYVYFYTEPMQIVEKGQALDFSKINREMEEQKFVLKKSNISPKKLKDLQGRFKKATETNSEKIVSPTPPRYDDVFIQNLNRLDEDKEY